jgi:hypothetical protein
MQVGTALLRRGASVVVLLLALAGAQPALAASGEAQAQPQPAPSGTPQTLIGVQPAPAVPPLPPISNPPTPPDNYSQPVGPFTMFMEVLASASPSANGLLAAPGCVTDSVYKRGMKLVFRFEVYDMDNKVRVTDADGSAAVVHIPNGPDLQANFLPRGAPGTNDPNAPWTWVAVWQIDPGYPLGPVMYNVEVQTPDGRDGMITPPSLPGQPVQPGVPLMVAGTYPTIIP